MKKSRFTDNPIMAILKRAGSGVPATRDVPPRPNKVWSMDFMFNSPANGRVFRAFHVIDDFNRTVRHEWLEPVNFKSIQQV